MSEEEKKALGVDLGEFLEFYLLDSQEQIDKLGTGLLQLEKEGSNISLINDLFRSAHSLKGASGTMGFNPIVSLTHNAEDLLDRLRQGKMDVSIDVIDTLLAVTDRVKAMLAQVEQHEEINIDDADLVEAMKALIQGEKPNRVNPSQAPGSETEQKGSNVTNVTNVPNEANESADSYVPLDFSLTVEEWETIKEAGSLGHGVYQLDVNLAPNTLMKAVRAVMAVQRAEGLGKVVKLFPSIDDLEMGNPEKFSLLVITDVQPSELEQEIMEVSEIVEVLVHSYPVNEEDVHNQVKDMVLAKQEAAATAVAALEQEMTVDESLQENSEPNKPNLQVASPQEGAGVSDAPRSDTAHLGTNHSGANRSAKTAQAQQAEGTTTGTTATATTTAATGNDGNVPVHTIRVDTARMDNLINLVGEMVITRTRLVQIGLDLKNAYRMDSLVNNLNETNVYLGRLMNDLQESVMRLRMVPIGTVFSRFPRLVRDLSRKTGKEIDLVLKGEDTELDKTVVEVIGDPLMHLIRNSVDHGIESPEERKAAGKPEVGQITLDAYHEGNHIAILITDDGAGLSLDKIRRKAMERGLISEREELSERDIANLIFLPGFSTADKVTDISGRGVGMDVVKKALNNLGGLIEIDTKRGQGTTFTIRLPLTLAIIQALLVEVVNEIYAVPLSSVLETMLITRSEIKTVGGLPMVQLRGNTLPLISLQEKFELPAPETPSEEVFVVVVGLGDKALGLVVDELRGQQEIVIKSLGDLLNNLPGIAGATILGDGKVTLILDIGSLIQDVLVSRKN